MEQTARVSIPLPAGAFEVSGSEAFVAAQVDAFREVLTSLLSNGASAPGDRVRGQPVQQSTPAGVPAGSSNDLKGGSEEYVGIFDISSGNVRILLDKMPGSSVKEQTVNAALLYLLGKQLLGIEEVSTNEVREVCKHFGFLDGSNFMSYLKEAKRMLLVVGSARTYSVKLTGPGRAQAKVLARQITPDDS